MQAPCVSIVRNAKLNRMLEVARARSLVTCILAKAQAPFAAGATCAHSLHSNATRSRIVVSQKEAVQVADTRRASEQVVSVPDSSNLKSGTETNRRKEHLQLSEEYLLPLRCQTVPRVRTPPRAAPQLLRHRCRCGREQHRATGQQRRDVLAGWQLRVVVKPAQPPRMAPARWPQKVPQRLQTALQSRACAHAAHSRVPLPRSAPAATRSALLLPPRPSRLVHQPLLSARQTPKLRCPRRSAQA